MKLLADAVYLHYNNPVHIHTQKCQTNSRIHPIARLLLIHFENKIVQEAVFL